MKNYWIWIGIRLVVAVCVLVLQTGGLLVGSAIAASDEPTPEPDSEEESRQPVPITDRLAPPVLPENPSQADKGARVYYGVCMACHGDRGQGLTEEWRAVWEEDGNCWQSGCHGPDYPPGVGFSIPETCCLPVLGPNTLLRYDNGQELYDYITQTMPWWNPGYLKTEEFWQVTAFLMREHNAITDEITLDHSNASSFSVNPASPPPGDLRQEALVVSGMLAATAGVLVWQNRKR